MRFKKLFAGFTAAALALSAIPAETLLAAEARGAVLPVKYEDGAGKWNSRGSSFWLPQLTGLSAEDVLISTDLYLPKELLPAGVTDGENFMPHTLDVRLQFSVGASEPGSDEPLLSLDYLGDPFVIEFVPDEGTVCYIPSEESSKPSLASFAAAEERGNYYVVHVKDCPVSDTPTSWNEETQKDEPVTYELPEGDNIEYWGSLIFNIGTENIDFDGRIAINNVSAKIGQKTVAIDFAERTDPNDLDIGDYWDDRGDQGRFQSAVFDDEFIINADADSVKVKKGKTKKLVLTKMTPDSAVSIDQSNPKIAKITLGNGTLKIKGKKKGTTTVYLKVDQTVKEIQVKVK